MKLYKKDGTLIVETEHTTVRYTVIYCTTNGISLLGAKLSGEDLSWTDLQGADLCGANLCGTYLCHANLYRANLHDTVLVGSNLSNSKGIYIFNKTNGRTCYAVQHEKCFMIQAGCFWGSLDDF